MDHDRVGGTTKTLGGEEGAGQIFHDVTSQAADMMDQAAGVAQDVVGQAADTARQAADAVQQGVKDADDYMRKMIEERPYTVALVALGIGWFIGRLGARD